MSEHLLRPLVTGEAFNTSVWLVSCVLVTLAFGFAAPALARRRREAAERHAAEKTKLQARDEMEKREMDLLDCIGNNCNTGRAPRWFTSHRARTDTDKDGPACWNCIGGYDPPTADETKDKWITRMEEAGKRVPDGWETSRLAQERRCVVCERRVPLVYAREKPVRNRPEWPSITQYPTPLYWVCLDCIDVGDLMFGARVHCYRRHIP